MFSRENWVGVLLLGVCAVVAIALLIEIFTDTTFEYTGPGWASALISIVGIVLIGIMSWRAWGGRLRRWRGGGAGGPAGWPHNDVPGRQIGRSRRTGTGDTQPDPTTSSSTAGDQPDQSRQ
jgi:peptidoglycan/LPS O-acetylase OafA/YrhL